MNTPQQTQQGPIPKDYYLGFNYALDRQSIGNLVALAQGAVGLKAKSITICLTSGGGAPDQSLYAYDILRALPVPVHTHAIGTVQSAGVTLFMCGEKRTASPGTNFLFHETVFTGTGPLRFDDLIGQSQAITHNDKWSHTLIAERLKRPLEEIAEWFVGQQIRDTQFALSKGVITEIKPLVVPPDAEFVQVAYKF